MNKELDLAIRKNKGKKILDAYKKVFLDAKFSNEQLLYISLEKSDSVIDCIKEIFPEVNEEVEVLPADATYTDSKLLQLLLAKDYNASSCYIFSDDVHYCGMYEVKSIVAREKCLSVAKIGYDNTCFLVDTKYRFSITINYYNEEETDFREQFIIKGKFL